LTCMGKNVLPVMLLDTEPPSDHQRRLPKYGQQSVLARYLRQFEKYARVDDRNAGARKFGFSSEREQQNELFNTMKSGDMIKQSTLESPIYRSLCVYQANVNTAYM